MPPGARRGSWRRSPIRLLPGVGPRAEERLHAAGVETIGALAALEDLELRAVLPGSVGRLLRDRARGIDPRDLDLELEQVSVSAEDTFARDVSERAVLHAEVRRLSELVSERLRSSGLSGRTVTAKLRYGDFSIRTRSTTLAAAVDEADLIADVACGLLDRGLRDRPGALRLVGVGVSSLSPYRQLTLDGLGAQQGAGKAGRAAVALPRDLVAGVDADLHARALHAAPRLGVAVERERPARAEREHVRPLRLELLVRHLDDVDAALGQERQQPDRREAWVDEREIRVERRDEGEQVQDLAGAVPVRQVERQHVDLRKGDPERGDRGLVRAVADPHEQRRLVEPERVPSFREHRRAQLGHDRDSGRLERGAERGRLAAPRLLAGAEQDGALAPDEDGVVRVDGIRVAGVVPRDDDLRPRLFEQRAECLVLGGRGCRVRRGSPAVLAPASGVLGQRRPDQNALGASPSSR